MTTIPLVYVAGPYRSETAWGREKNIHAAKLWGVALAKAGAYPVIPHANTAHFDGEAGDDFWLSGTLALLRRCDGIILIDGWFRSTGARGEMLLARELKMPILDCDGWAGRGGSNVANDLGAFVSELISKPSPVCLCSTHAAANGHAESCAFAIPRI